MNAARAGALLTQAGIVGSLVYGVRLTPAGRRAALTLQAAAYFALLAAMCALHWAETRAARFLAHKPPAWDETARHQAMRDALATTSRRNPK